MDSKTVTLQPIAMRVPNRAGVYAPSRLLDTKKISENEFMSKFADNPRVIQVSFKDDGISNPQCITAYGRGLDCWYIVTDNNEADQ